MPHSGDNKILSCAGDSEVRIFDLERSGTYLPDGSHQDLSTISTSAKVYRSHSDSVKRLVTEDSPFYFLTCSEDGDIRQWDIRQPESRYPKPKTYFGGDRVDDNVPPPLISYRDYNMSLYTVSCSARQPHYIALGGTHLHCFLHDRRMLGRDKLRERGGAFSPSYCSDSELDAICQATRCVRKFAPHGQPTMNRTSDAQITACKLGNYNPNELIVSWTGDDIYSFDIRRDDEDSIKGFSTNKTKSAPKTRKRKRVSNGSHGGLSEDGDIRGHSRSRTLSAEPQTLSEQASRRKYALLVRLRDGTSHEIPIRETNGSVDGDDDEAMPLNTDRDQDHDSILSEMVRDLKYNILESIRGHEKRMWSTETPEQREETNLTILAKSIEIFKVVDENVKHWHYPTTRNSSEVHYQQKLRDDRNKIWRFVQCSGTIVRALLNMSSHTQDPELRDSLQFFDMIRPAPRESSRPLDKHEQFCYDFIKAVLLWLDSGAGAVLREFQADPEDLRYYPKRQPVCKDAELDALQTQLFPYLRSLAMDRPVVPCDDRDDGTRTPFFDTEFQAVNALEKVIDVPFTDLVGENNTNQPTTENGVPSQQSREQALRFWGMGVCRALLEAATTDLNLKVIEAAFEGPLVKLELLRDLKRRTEAHHDDSWMERIAERFIADNDQNDDQSNADDNEDDTEGDSDDEAHDDESEDNDSDTDDEEDDDDHGYPMFRPRRDYKVRAKAGKNVPCTTHSRSYKGHCNVETTKDVNFYGLQDEYIMSGSDCGHLFIWDKKSSKLVQILDGDGEVVNVMQSTWFPAFFLARQDVFLLTCMEGHPNEPMIAVSGIDSTIKIFSPDAHARRNAALGISVQEADPSTFSSILGRQRRRGANNDASNLEDREEDENDWIIVAENGLRSRQRLHNAYEITSDNEMRNSRGRESSFISSSVVQVPLNILNPSWTTMGANIRIDNASED